jgi:ribonuclease BN (tRNA processing enzyme)
MHTTTYFRCAVILLAANAFLPVFAGSFLDAPAAQKPPSPERAATKRAASKPASNKHAEMELIVLGSGGPRSFGRGETSYVVLIAGTPRVLVDAGSGAFVESGKLNLDLDRMDIVLLTHLHIDHSADLPSVFNERALGSDDPIQFRVFGPEGAGLFPSTTKFLHLLFDKGGIYEYQKTFGADETIRGTDLPITLDSPEKEIVTEGDLHVRGIATHHGDCPSVAYRVEYKDQSITFAGDMDASALGNLEKLAKGTDLLVLHAAVLDPPDTPAILFTLHTAPKGLGEAAHGAGAKRVLLSHIPPVVEDHAAAVLRSVHNSYSGPVEFARDGQRIVVTK